jgi:hypothetical protein
MGCLPALPMKVLVICRPNPGGDRSRFQAALPDELAALRGLKASGVLVEAWSPDGPGAVLLLDVADATEGATVAAGLPLAAAGLISTEVIALRPIEL